MAGELIPFYFVLRRPFYFVLLYLSDTFDVSLVDFGDEFLTELFADVGEREPRSSSLRALFFESFFFIDFQFPPFLIMVC